MKTYQNYRENIRSGDIIAFTHTKWDTFYDFQVQAVRAASFTEYSHVGVAVVMGGRVWIAESVTPLVRFVPLSNFAKEGFFVIHTDTDMTEDELEFLLSKVGNGKYSKWQAVLAWFDKLTLGADNLFECAEYVILARRLSGLDLGNRAVPAAVVKEALNRGFPMYWLKET